MIRRDTRRCALRLLAGVLVAGAFIPVFAGALRDELGRSEVRVRSEPFRIVAGRTVSQSALVERLERLGYARVSSQPDEVGQFFFGHEVFWIYRRGYRWGGKRREARLLGLSLRRGDGMIAGGLSAEREEVSLDKLFRLEPETLAESLDGDRAVRVPIDIEDLPSHVWLAVLAAEDARYFSHDGVDTRSVARAALANVKSGGVVQGGSTITQQLIKNRDLTPQRSFGRKVSEAVRALALEAEYDKKEILEAYLDQVYLGHVDGLAVHGFGAAARVYFSKSVTRLSLAEAATLAAMIQGPNRLSPVRHASRVVERRNWVLSRLEELNWVSDAASIREARDSRLKLKLSAPLSRVPRSFLRWVSDVVSVEAPRRLAKERGFVVETSLDPWLQAWGEESVRRRLKTLRREHSRLRDSKLSAALVTLDVSSGAVLAYVGGDPDSRGDEFDRVRVARRQPGSTVKPLVLLEAFESCGRRDPLHPASRVADEPLHVSLPSGDWSPSNYDGQFLGTIDVRRALAESRNVPFVRIARWCGLEATAGLLERTGLSLPDEPPPSFALGAVEVSPLELASAYTVLATPGQRVAPLPVWRIEKPEGNGIARLAPRRRQVVHASTAFLVHDLLIDAVERGTARVAALSGVEVAAKTGSSSELRDAWLVGHAGSLVTVVWVGLDDGGPLGLSGAAAAGPLWREFMERAVPARPARRLELPRGIVERYVDPRTGLLVRSFNVRARKELFRQVAQPPRDRFFRSDTPVPVVR